MVSRPRTKTPPDTQDSRSGVGPRRSLPRRPPSPKQKPVRRDAEDRGEGLRGGGPSLPPAGELLACADRDLGRPIEGSEGDAAHAAEQEDEATAGGRVGNHGSYNDPSGTTVVKDEREEAHDAGDPASVDEETRRARREIAERVRGYCTAQGISPRQLSLTAGWDGSHLGTVLRRLERGRDVETGTLTTIAKYMGKPFPWLVTGEMPEGIRLDSLGGWAAVAAEAVERFGLDSSMVAAVGAMRVPEAPKRLEAHTVAALARSWSDATR